MNKVTPYLTRTLSRLATRIKLDLKDHEASNRKKGSYQKQFFRGKVNKK